MHKKNQIQGFSLLELMIVVGIIAILATIALPSNVGRLTRLRVAETHELIKAQSYQSDISATYKSSGTFPTNNAQAGIPEPEKIIGKYLQKLEVEDGAIHLVLGQELPESLHGKIVSLRPIYVEDNPELTTTWICGHENVPDGMSVAGQNLTNLDPLFLPLSCR